MSTNFLSLSRELRDQIYEHLVVHREPIDPWPDDNRRYKLTPGLLRANETIHHEASLLLYTQNRFDFTMCASKDVASFLEQIGRNANYIQHICVAFPKFHYLDLHDVTLEDDSVRILEKIQSDCTKLSTLTACLYSTNGMELKLHALDHPKIVAEALALVHARFRAISSLPEIIVEVYEDGLSADIRRRTESHGWTIKVTELVEESGSDRSFGDIEDDDYRYDDDTWDDDYDIDNDSDFWRRAGD